MNDNVLGRDYDRVHDELIYVQRCRNAVFLGTFGLTGALATTGLAVLASIQSSDSTAAEFLLPQLEWFVLAFTLAYLVAFFGIYCTTIKGREINKLSGFLMLLSRGAREKNALPKSYQGWKHYELSLRDCSAFRACSLCPKVDKDNKDYQKPKDRKAHEKDIWCERIGREKAYDSLTKIESIKKTTTTITDRATGTKEVSAESPKQNTGRFQSLPIPFCHSC